MLADLLACAITGIPGTDYWLSPVQLPDEFSLY